MEGVETDDPGKIIQQGDETGRSDKMSLLLSDPMLRPLLDDLCQWLARILAIDIDAQNFTIPLQTGDDLCRLGLAISNKASELGMKCPTLKYKAGAKAGSFQARCNIEAFVKWAKALGVRETCLFETVDIVELHYLRNVLVCLLEISKLADVYGVEPPELVKLEKSTKINWQDLIKLSMKRTSTADVMTVADITSAVGAIQKEVDESDGSFERSSSIVLKWKEFTRNSIRSRGEPVAADPSRILEDDAPVEPTLEVEDVDVQEPAADITIQSSEEEVVRSFDSEARALIAEARALISPAPELLEDCNVEDEDIPTVQKILVDPVCAQPDLLNENSSEANVNDEADNPTQPDLGDIFFALQIETIDSPIPVSPTHIAVLVHSDSVKMASGSDNLEDSDNLQDSIDLQDTVMADKAESRGYTNIAYEDQGTGISAQHQPSTSQVPQKSHEDSHDVQDDSGTKVTVTWCFALCYPAVERNRDGSSLTSEQFEELGLKRLAFLLLGIVLIMLGCSIAITVGVLGVDDGSVNSTGQLSVVLVIVVLAVAMLALIIGMSLVSLWVVQQYKLKSKKLSDYETLPSYGTIPAY